MNMGGYKTESAILALVAAVMLLLMVAIMIHTAAAAQSQIPFKGTLVNEPCTVATGQDGDNVAVNFNAVPDKNFYDSKDGRSWPEPFHIVLQDCDLTLGTTVKVTFTGTPDSEQTDLLAVESGAGSASHVAVAITTPEGVLIPINKSTDGYLLQKGTMTLKFNAYLQASRDALNNHSIGDGNVNAIATFTLEYS